MTARPAILALSLLLALPMTACNRPGAGGEARDLGGACTSDRDCASRHCVGGVAPDGPRCTRVCGEDGDCPEGWSCGAVTAAGTVVCQLGSSSPLGPPSRSPPRPAAETKGD